MKLITTLATVALIWAGAAKANDFAMTIEQTYLAAGYSNIVVQHLHGDWLVTGDLAGVSQTFLVNRKTGASTPVDPTQFASNDDHGGHGAGHDVGDDHGVHGAGHDVGDDHGDDGAGHDVGDDHGVDGAGHDVGDDHGGSGSDDNDDDYGGSGDDGSDD